jgi:alcohol dehydrogenase YqhD (iron-dependent ADH family)
MPNIRVRQALEKIDAEINRVGRHIVEHSGIDPKDAYAIRRDAVDIAKTAEQIVQLAEEAASR